MEWIWWITIGLVLDGIGVGFFISPLLHVTVLNPKKSHNEKVIAIAGSGDAWKAVLKARLTWIGFALLMIGFIFQIIGNWFQYLE